MAHCWVCSNPQCACTKCSLAIPTVTAPRLCPPVQYYTQCCGDLHTCLPTDLCHHCSEVQYTGVGCWVMAVFLDHCSEWIVSHWKIFANNTGLIFLISIILVTNETRHFSKYLLAIHLFYTFCASLYWLPNFFWITLDVENIICLSVAWNCSMVCFTEEKLFLLTWLSP